MHLEGLILIVKANRCDVLGYIIAVTKTKVCKDCEDLILLSEYISARTYSLAVLVKGSKFDQ